MIPTWAVVSVVAGLAILVGIAVWDAVMDERERRRHRADVDPDFFKRLGRDMARAAHRYDRLRKGRL